MTNRLEELVHAIRTGAESRVVKPERIGVQDATCYLKAPLGLIERALREGLDTPRYKGFLEMAKQKFGAKIEGQNAYLCPVTPITQMKSDFNYPDLNYLSHLGMIVNGSDNIENLRNQGVFGNPNSARATYLARLGVSPTTCGNHDVVLSVDKTRLMEKRNIFIDPETIGGNQLLKGYPVEEVGDFYFVLGGIPREAVTHINGEKIN